MKVRPSQVIEVVIFRLTVTLKVKSVEATYCIVLDVVVPSTQIANPNGYDAMDLYFGTVGQEKMEKSNTIPNVVIAEHVVSIAVFVVGSYDSPKVTELPVNISMMGLEVVVIGYLTVASGSRMVHATSMARH